jgi:hypothetical protein
MVTSEERVAEEHSSAAAFVEWTQHVAGRAFMFAKTRRIWC